MTEEIIITTKDNVRIYADYYKEQKPDSPGVVLLHMMPATKESWRDFGLKLQQAGFQALAIDFRGHGKSTVKNGEILDYKNFNDKEHQQKIHDVEEAIRFLTNKNNPASILFFVGASIGANIALQYMSEHARIRGGVLLSPGLDYRGVRTEPLIKKIANDQSLFLAAGGDNDIYSTETIEKLYEMATCKKQLKIVKNGGHGTDLFIAEPELMDEIIKWLKNIYQIYK